MENRNKIAENIFWIIIALGMIVIIPMQVSDEVAVNGIGARFFPRLAAYVILIPNVIRLVINLVKKKAEQEENLEETHDSFFERNKIIVITLLLVFASTFLVQYAGFILTYCVLCGLLMLIYGVKKIYVYLIVFGIISLIYLFFTKLMYIPLPSLFL